MDKYNNLSICSYNILWEIMNYDNTKRFINTDKKLLKIYKNNILFNIQKLIDYYNPTIYCFQEAASYNDILKLFDKNYLYKINKSDKEFMLTIWQKTKLELISSFEGEFEKGRPFNILIFLNKIDNYKFILINIHASHDIDTNKSIIKPIQDVIDTIDNLLLKDIHRIIISGDFNRDINEDINNKIKINNYYLLINKQKITFKYNKNNNKTCCNIYGNNNDINKNYDNIIDSYKKLKLIHPLNKESWYKYPSSDHVMILGIIQ
jgi:hypothetical protein